MKFMKKLFGGIKMTWLRLILFSIVIGVLVGVIMVMPAFADNAIREIGIGYEMWFILAIFVIVNCDSMLDAAVKCFVFFLISQPLIYLVQQPFASVNLIEMYYWPWLVKTICCFPAAMVAYQIKREDILGTLVLSVAGIALGILGINTILTAANLSYIIYGIFQIAAAVFFAWIFCPTMKLKAVYLVLVIAISGGFSTYHYLTNLEQTNAIGLADGHTWTIESVDAYDADAQLRDATTLVITSKSNAHGEVLLKNEEGEYTTIDFLVEDGTFTISYSDPEED